ncbi:YciI family protein [Paenibacillus arenilitoris]|uniref:YCII-related domain-containing protein n=1 Tax=Paenibacillus arenilitoris TaxID=2772299 RepID=A0A927H6A8_9BACL|nr:YciI family protein [Paenibacillus arenilitoris]MBD2869312.1 hypothetical protein [Paenibacillus arenilitoris]
MKFLCIGYFHPDKMDARPKEEMEAIMRECEGPLKAFYESGQVLLDAGLDKETKHLRRSRGKVTVLDGPYSESKEMIGSAFIIEARPKEEAIRVASLHPAVQAEAGEQLGWRVEIRPIRYFADLEEKMEGSR